MNGAPSSSSALHIDVCVCTFRRAHIAKTLRSLSQLVLKPDWVVRIIVADNDETPSARSLVETAARECGVALTYIHAPARNISVARNACLDAAQSSLIAFVDDDEVVAPDWLDALVAEMESSHADVILGRVQAVYGPECPDWMRKGDFHAPKPVWVRNEIRTGYTCNVLFQRTAPAFRGLRFRKEFGRSGGEDTVFFAAVYRAGGRFSYAPEAIVTEDVTPDRARFLWLLKRSFRFGQTHGSIVLEDNGDGLPVHLKSAAIACAKAVFCFVGAVFSITRAARVRYWILRGAMHVGVVSRILGKHEVEQYG